MIIDTFEPGDSGQFTWVSSVAPDAAPTFKVYGIAGSVIASISALSSSTTQYYAIYTTPTSQGMYLAQWVALKTVNGSAYNFLRTFPFQVLAVTAP